MGLISEWVEVGLNAQTAKHYESLGYNIPKTLNAKGKPYVKVGTKILVRVEHLTTGSNCLVEVECEECHKRYFIRYLQYCKHNYDNLVYCMKCSRTLFHSGKNNKNWNPNKTVDERLNGRCYPEYKEFVKSVLARDNYTCQVCGKKNDGNVEVHHLYGYAGFPKYRIDQTQALVLCETCHKAFHNWHGQHYGYANKGNCTREQFEEWCGKVVKELEEYNGMLIATRKVYCIDNNTVYDSAEIAYKDLDLYSASQIYKVCNGKQYVTQGYHFLWYDDYITMTEDEVREYVAKCNNPDIYRKVICIETKEVFHKPIDASLKYCGDKKGGSSIIVACREVRTALKDKNDNPLHWMYYDEYLQKIENGEEITVHQNKNTKKKVVCVTTGEVFDSIKDATIKYKLASTHISACCGGKNHYAGRLADDTPLEWMYYEEYLKKINNGEKIEPLHKKIICVTTGEIFATEKMALKKYGLKSKSKIHECCQGKAKSIGELSDGTRLVWMYYTDYLDKKNNGETINTSPIYSQYVKCICLTTGEVFDSLHQAMAKYNIIKGDYQSTTNLSNCCKGKHKYCGKLPDGTPLKWMYYSDFLNLPQEKQKEILNRNKDSSITDGSFIM